MISMMKRSCCQWRNDFAHEKCKRRLSMLNCYDCIITTAAVTNSYSTMCCPCASAAAAAAAARRRAAAATGPSLQLGAAAAVGLVGLLRC